MTQLPASRLDEALERLDSIASLPLVRALTPLEEMVRLRAELGGGPRLLVKRDDAIPFGFGGNKVRKLQLVAAQALAEGADTLVTCGGVQSNHARATAATAARLGLGCVIVANGLRPPRLTANALLDELLGAEVEYVTTRAERDAGMQRVAERLRREGRVPCVIPLGASTPRGAVAFARAVGEMLRQVPAPDVIVHACSSGGTQAGLLVGCALNGVSTRVIGVSADDPAGEIADTVSRIIRGIGPLVGVEHDQVSQIAGRDLSLHPFLARRVRIVDGVRAQRELDVDALFREPACTRLARERLAGHRCVDPLEWARGVPGGVRARPVAAERHEDAGTAERVESIRPSGPLADPLLHPAHVVDGVIRLHL